VSFCRLKDICVSKTSPLSFLVSGKLVLLIFLHSKYSIPFYVNPLAFFFCHFHRSFRILQLHEHKHPLSRVALCIYNNILHPCSSFLLHSTHNNQPAQKRTRLNIAVKTSRARVRVILIRIVIGFLVWL